MAGEIGGFGAWGRGDAPWMALAWRAGLLFVVLIFIVGVIVGALLCYLFKPQATWWQRYGPWITHSVMTYLGPQAVAGMHAWQAWNPLPAWNPMQALPQAQAWAQAAEGPLQWLALQ